MVEYLEVSSVDEFDDVNQALDWQTEYLQFFGELPNQTLKKSKNNTK